MNEPYSCPYLIGLTFSILGRKIIERRLTNRSVYKYINPVIHLFY